MWQKARIINNPRHPELAGYELWVKSEQPHEDWGWDMENGETVEGLMLYTNIVGVKGSRTATPVQCIELLPEFADSVVHLSWLAFKSRKPADRDIQKR